MKNKGYFGLLIGNPVEKSISHITHNKVLENLGRYEKRLISEENFSEEIRLLKQEKVDWLGVTMPFKEKVIPYLDEIDREAHFIGAVNTIVVKRGKWKGYNTDGIGGCNAIEEIVPLKGKKVLILGAGGAARALVFEAKKRGAHIILWNRTYKKGVLIGEYFGVESVQTPSPADILINATCVGMNQDDEEIPLSLEEYRYVFDTVYNPHETKLLREAQKKGAIPIYGIEMFIHLSALQFELVFGKKKTVGPLFSPLKAGFK